MILQHPRERHMPIGTARMASLALSGAELWVGRWWDHDQRLRERLSDREYPPVLLYPGVDAVDVMTQPPPGPVTLVVVDGTWPQAKTVVRDNACLRALPKIAFSAPVPSEYRIRKEPSVDVVSTIEALMHVLGALEGNPERFAALLSPLRTMVDTQLAKRAAQHTPRYRRVRDRKPDADRLPRELSDRWKDLVLVVGEANAWPKSNRSSQLAADSRRPDELVQWVAHRVATGETFGCIAAPRGPLASGTSFHTELAADALTTAPPLAQLHDEWKQFRRPNDVLATWGLYAAELWNLSGGPPEAAWLDLRAAAQRWTNRKMGTLELYASTLGPPPLPLAPGRGGRRLALLAHVAHAWKRILDGE